MGLVADHDRVGVGDLAGVADEPLVGLDRDRAVGVVLVAEQRRREPVLVAAVGDLADELVDEVAAVGEDQDAAGARGLDEADGGDRLAGAGRVLEPEAAARARVLGRLGDDVLVDGLRLVPVLGLLVLGELLGQPRRPRRRASSPAAAPFVLAGGLRGGGLVAVALPFAVAVAARFDSSSSVTIAARVPESASTWCSFSVAPSSSFGSSSARTRSRPSSSE